MAGSTIDDEVGRSCPNQVNSPGRVDIRREIAAELVLSTATIKTLVNHILTTLRRCDRVQAIVLAYRSGLVDRGRGGRGRLDAVS